MTFYRKGGCNRLVSEGAEGMLQAMVLSFGGLQSTHHDLKVNADADILHNDIAFRGVMYKNNTIDIKMHYENEQSTIQVSLTGNGAQCLIRVVALLKINDVETELFFMHVARLPPVFIFTKW